jgi:YD repeat-containing protein
MKLSRLLLLPAISVLSTLANAEVFSLNVALQFGPWHPLVAVSATAPGYFDSPGAIIEAANAYNRLRCPDSIDFGQYTDLRPISYLNGRPDRYGASVTMYWCDGGQPKDGGSSGFEAVAQLLNYCPEAIEPIKAVSVTGKPNTYCQLWFDTQPVKRGSGQCGKGNPIYASTSSKRERQVDYVDPHHVLSHVRVHSSANLTPSPGGFDVESVSRMLLPGNRVGLDQRRGCIPVVVVDPKKGTLSRCVPYFSEGAADYTKVMLVDEDGASTTFLKNADGSYSAQGGAPLTLERLTSTWVLRHLHDGRHETYSDTGALVKTAWIDGRSVEVRYASSAALGVAGSDRPLPVERTDSRGRSVKYVYDSAGRIKEFVDPAGGRIQYAYSDDSSRLVVTYPGSERITYLFGETDRTAGVRRPFALTGKLDSAGRRVGTYSYAANGDAIATSSAGGLGTYTITTTSSADRTYRAATVTDPLGSKYQEEYQLIGDSWQLTSSTQPAGSGCAASASRISYDGNGAVRRRDTVNGNSVCYTRDARGLELLRGEGWKPTDDCGTLPASWLPLPEGARKFSTTWHSLWALKSREALPGVIRTMVYNGEPDPFNGGAVASCAPADAVLVDGKTIAVLCKTVEQATTDVDGSKGFGATVQSGVPIRTTTATYNRRGQILTSTDPLGRTTVFEYYADTTTDHALGDLKSMKMATGEITQFLQYNKHGQLLKSTDANGVATTVTYDLRQRLASLDIGGERTQFTHHPTGQVKRILMPDASRLDYVYDVAERLTAIVDGAGNRIENTFDAAGNQTAERMKDPAGILRRQLTQLRDALGRVKQVTGSQ